MRSERNCGLWATDSDTTTVLHSHRYRLLLFIIIGYWMLWLIGTKWIEPFINQTTIRAWNRFDLIRFVIVSTQCAAHCSTYKSFDLLSIISCYWQIMTNLKITISHCLLLLGISCHWIAAGHSANILAIIPAPSPSHHIMQTRILSALAARGHNVRITNSKNQNIHSSRVSVSTSSFVFLGLSHR